MTAHDEPLQRRVADLFGLALVFPMAVEAEKAWRRRTRPVPVTAVATAPSDGSTRQPDARTLPIILTRLARGVLLL
jgi:hypothetical protein